MNIEVLKKIQEKINQFAESKIENGSLKIYGGDYDIYTEPSITDDGLLIETCAFGSTQQCLITWEELDQARKA